MKLLNSKQTITLISVIYISFFTLVSWNIHRENLNTSVYIGETILGQWTSEFNQAVIRFNSDATCHLDNKDYKFLKFSGKQFWVYNQKIKSGFLVTLSENDSEIVINEVKYTKMEKNS